MNECTSQVIIFNGSKAKFYSFNQLPDELGKRVESNSTTRGGLFFPNKGLFTVTL